MGLRGKEPNPRLKERDYKFANLVLSGMGLREAALECGFGAKSPQTSANRVMNKPAVIAYMTHERQRRAEIIRQETEVDDLWITKKFKEILDRCMQAQPLMKYDHEAGEMRQVQQDGQLLYTFDSMAALRAAENLAKHIGYYEVDNRQKATVIKIGCNTQNVLNFFESDEKENAISDEGTTQD